MYGSSDLRPVRGVACIGDDNEARDVGVQTRNYSAKIAKATECSSVVQ